MSFLLLFIFLISIVLFSRWLFAPRKRNDHAERTPEERAEIEGNVWPAISVFEHIERGLKTKPNEPAVLCLFQPANHLDSLLVGTSTTPKTNGIQEVNGLWHKHNNSSPPSYAQVNGFSMHSTLDIKQENGHDETAPKAQHLILTYTQLHRIALKIAAGLLANGVQPDSTMLMVIPNGGEYALLLWACVLLRITYVCLAPDSLDISGFTALKHTLKTLRPQLVVAPDAASGKAIDVAVSELKLSWPIRICLSGPSLARSWKSLAQLVTDGGRYPIDEAALLQAARHDSPFRIHSIMFTSGTSGFPKGCPMRVGGMSHALHSQSWLVDDEAGAFALMQPHNSRGIAPAQTLQTWRAGGAVVLTGQVFSAKDAVSAISDVAVTFLVLTPPMVHEMAVELAARPGVRVDSVKRVQVGGDAVTKGVLTRCAALFPQAQVVVNHGMTEGPGAFTWPFLTTPVDNIPFFGEICPTGMVAPGSMIRIWDDDKGCVVARGQLGELHIASPSLIKNYLGGASDASFYQEGARRWFRTGDNAVVNSQGVVTILGRKKDMIKRAGVGIMPAAIESSLEAYTGAQVIVVPVRHHVLGSEPFAVLSTMNGKSEADIKAHVRAVFGKDYAIGGLASLKQLGLVEFPLNPTHKVIKSEVQLAVQKHVVRISKQTACV